MSLFDYVEFLDLARSLIGRTPGGSTDEAAWRSAVSRAYYAAYHVALDYAVSKALPPAVLPPGNKAGGLTTILEKSLGAVAKGGTTNLVDVYEYAEPVTAKGFVYMDTPGYDPVSATGQIAGGANLVCFTTGRGSAYGCKPAPSLKLATNTRLFEHQEEDMDMNCGTIVDGKESIGQVGQKLFELILKTASGEKTKSEVFGYGEDEFAPWVLGATM